MNEKKRLRIGSIVIVTIVVMGIFWPLGKSSPVNEETTGTPPDWTNDIRITDHPNSDVSPSIACLENFVNLVWERRLSNNYEIFYINSTNAGRNWNSPIQITSDISGIYCKNPDICVTNSNINVVWEDNDAIAREIKYRSSNDSGSTWNSPKMISSDDGAYSEVPKIAVSDDGQSIHVVWVDSRHGAESFPTNTEIYYTRSLDGGVTWEVERRLTSAFYNSASQEIFAVGNTIHIVWGDGRNGITTGDVYYKVSYNNGATWEDGLGNVNQDRLLTTNSTNHGTPHFAVSGSMVNVVWFDQVGSDYYIYYRKSNDNGVSWGTIQRLVGPFPGSSYRPKLAVENETVHMTWMDMRDDGSTREIYYKNSTDGGTNWNPDLRLTYSLGTNSWWPEIAVEGSAVHIAWYDQRDGNSEIYYKRSPDFPETTPPIHTNETPLPDSFKDAPGTNISVHVTDPSGVNASTIQLWVNGSLVSHILSPIIDGYNVSWVSGGFGPGVVTCRIVADDNLGNVLDYTWNFTVLALYEIQLQEGWNLVSLPLEQVDASISNVLASITGKWSVIKYYDTLDKADPWKTYRVGSSMNDLASIDNTMGFWIYINQPNVNLTVRGNIPAFTTISLYAGWNLVGYPAQATQTVGNALWGTGADRVEGFDSVSPYIKEVGATYVMKPGEGYWIHVPADSTWTINW
jgi:hypothetical protein